MKRLSVLWMCLFAVAAHAQPQTTVEPLSADSSGGALITMHGKGFLGSCAGADCSFQAFFGDTPAQVVSASDDTIVMVAPPHRPGRTTILVGRPGVFVALNRYFYYEANQETFPYGTVLLPLIWTGDTQGAYGSVWRASLVVHDQNAGKVVPDPTYLPKAGDPNPSRFLHLDGIQEPSETTTIQLRVQEISRQSETWGVEIPIVRDTDLHVKRVTLSEVPTDSRFRVALRIYMVNGMRETGSVSMPFHLRVFPADEQKPIVDDVVVVKTPYATDLKFPPEPLYPAIYQNFDLALAYPAIAGYEKVRVEIEPDGLLSFPAGSTSRQPLFWAFIGVAHKDSQQVTIISPQ